MINGMTSPLSDVTTLVATRYHSGFEFAHDSYNAISCASDGKIYYILSSVTHNVGGRMYVFEPGTRTITFLADLDEVCGEKGSNTISQGKSHAPFFERDGKLYFSTHIGFYETISGMDRMPANLPDGFAPYPGGHILSYDINTRQFEDLVTIPSEGIVAMTMDIDRGHIYGITWPKGNFIHYNVNNNKLANLGPVCNKGDESGVPGNNYRVLCRSLVVDPRCGSVYFSVAEGDIFVYDPALMDLKELEGIDLRLDYFGKYDPTQPGDMGYNWRQIFWYSPEQVAYGVHGNSGYLFRFDPNIPSIEIVERITSEPSRNSGMFDQFSYGYLGFQLGPDGNTIYYLTGGPIYINGKRLQGKNDIRKGAAKGLENLHLVTFNIPQNRYRDHGPIYFEDKSRPSYVNSIAIATDGTVYTLARVEQEGKVIRDLVEIKGLHTIGVLHR